MKLMSRDEAFRCDVCKKVKGEANHWFLAVVVIAGDGIFGTPGMLAIGPWTKDGALYPLMTHLCGEQCAQKKLSEFLSRRAA